MFKGKLIELPQLEHPPLIYELQTTLLLMIICLFFPRKSYQKQGNRRCYSNVQNEKGIKGITAYESSACRELKNKMSNKILNSPGGEEGI